MVTERLRELSAELVMPQMSPALPRGGDNEALLDWCEACAIANENANDQLAKIRALQDGH